MTLPVHQVERFGVNWQFTWPTVGVCITAKSPREVRSDLACVLTVTETVNDDELLLSAPTRLTLTSASGKRDLTRALNEAREWPPDTYSWGDALEGVSTVVQRDWARGEPVLDLAGVELGENEVPYLLRPYLPMGEVTALYGDGGNGKSVFALSWALAVLTGQPVPHSSDPALTGPVLYLDWETHHTSQARRLRQIAAGIGLEELPTNFYYRKCSRPIIEDCEQLAADCARLDIALVVIDSLGWASGADINEASVAINVMAAIRSLGCTALVVAHSPKTERQASGRRSIAGSGFFEFAARSAWEIRSRETGTGTTRQAALYHRKANDSKLTDHPLGVGMEFSNDEGKPIRFHPGEVKPNDELSKGSPLPGRIRQTLGRATRPATINEIATYLQCKVGEATTALQAMPDVHQVKGADGAAGGWALKAPEKEEASG